MANKKLSELTEITEITNDNTLVYLVDPARAAGDKSVGINKTNLQAAIGGGSSSKIIDHYSIEDKDGVTYEKWVQRDVIFQQGESIDGVTYDTYRIPSLQYAPNGDLLAFCEGRVSGFGDDIPADILLARIRNGVIISKEILVAKLPAENVLRNPNTVIKDDVIYMFFTGIENDTEGTPNTTNDLKNYYIQSSDNGVTWTSRTEFLASDQDQNSAFKYMISPANSILHSSGDIIIPFWGKYVNDPFPNYYRVGIIVWNGTTFTKRLLDAEENANESTIYEREGGTIVISSRRGSTGIINRVVYNTNDKGVTWNLDASTGKEAGSVYVHLRRFGNELFRCEIDPEGDTLSRDNLRLYKTDLSNNAYEKVIDITPTDVFNWGYACSANYIGNFSILQDNETTLDLYNVFVKDRGILNISKKLVTLPDPDFFAPMALDGDDDIIPLTATNAGGVTFPDGVRADFNGNDNSNLQYADNAVFDFSDGTNDLAFTMSFRIKQDATINSLFLNKNGALGTNRTWDCRVNTGTNIRFLLFSELDNSNHIYFENSTTISNGIEYKVDVVYDGSGGLQVFVDENGAGSLVEVGTYVKLGQSSNVVTVGRLLTSSTFNFDGTIRDFKIFKGVALTAAQRALL